MRICHFIIGLSTLALFACASNIPSKPSNHLDELSALMIGSFSSERQSKHDDQYYDIRLEMVQIWPQRTDATWLYVEQASAQALAQPYRQRVYKLTHAEDAYTSEVYELPEPTGYIGGWRNPQTSFASLAPEALKLRVGCAVVMKRRSANEYVGETVDDHCKSTLRGATYATSEVYIERNGIRSWDRGYDADGEQVWGAVLGPYDFQRL